MSTSSLSTAPSTLAADPLRTCLPSTRSVDTTVGPLRDATWSRLSAEEYTSQVGKQQGFDYYVCRHEGSMLLLQHNPRLDVARAGWDPASGAAPPSTLDLHVGRHPGEFVVVLPDPEQTRGHAGSYAQKPGETMIDTAEDAASAPKDLRLTRVHAHEDEANAFLFSCPAAMLPPSLRTGTDANSVAHVKLVFGDKDMYISSGTVYTKVDGRWGRDDRAYMHGSTMRFHDPDSSGSAQIARGPLYGTRELAPR